MKTLKSCLFFVLLAVALWTLLPVDVAVAQSDAPVIPLPPGCVGNTPVGEPLPACCISGFVFMEGQPVAGAEVEIVSANGRATLLTQVHETNSDKRPHYRLNLSGAPLNVQVGDAITLTARYSGHEDVIANYVVQSGGQQVDLVLARTGTTDYAFGQPLWSSAAPGTFNSPWALAVDSEDNVYVLDRLNARIQVFDTNGQFIRMWGVKGREPGQFLDPLGLAIDPNNYVYVMERNRVQKFASDGEWITTWGTRFSTLVAIVADNQGDIYLVAKDFPLQKYNSLGNLLATWSNVTFDYFSEIGLAVDKDNHLYVTDSFSNILQKFDSNGNLLLQLGGRGSENGKFEGIAGVTIDRNGNILVADSNNRRIQKFSKEGHFVISWIVAENPLVSPRAIVIDSVANIYITNGTAGPIYKLSESGSVIGNLGIIGNNKGVYLFPTQSVAVDGMGNIFFGNAPVGGHFADGRHLLKYDQAGNLLNTWDITGELNDVAVNTLGEIFVADLLNNQIQRLDPNGNFINSWGTKGNNDSQFDGPLALAINMNNDIFVVDSNNYRVQKFDNVGNFIHSWGKQGSNDGEFNFLRNIAVDGNNHLFVYDVVDSNIRIQIFDSDGNFVKSITGFSNSFDDIGVDKAGNLVTIQDNFNSVSIFDNNGNLLSSWRSFLERI